MVRIGRLTRRRATLSRADTSASRLFAVRRRRGPGWRTGRRMERQPGWAAHAAFMDGLAALGFVMLGGPLAGTRDVLLIVRAPDARAIRARLARDPWVRARLLDTVEIRPWALRLGALDAPVGPPLSAPRPPSGRTGSSWRRR